MPAHTRVCQCGAGIRAEQWPQRSQQMIKAPVCPRFLGCFFFLYHLTSLLADGFIPTLFVRVSSKNVGRRWKQLVQGGLGPASRYSAWLNKQHQAGRGREGRIEGSAQGTGALSPVAGWVARTPGVQREPFFALCRQNGGSCCCLGASARPRPRLYRIPLALNAASLLSLTEPPSLTHSHIPVHPSPVPDQLGVCSVL